MTDPFTPTLITLLFPGLLGVMALALLGYVAVALWNRQLNCALARQQAALTATTNRLKAAEALAHLGHWQCAVATGDVQWSDETYRIFGLEPQSQLINLEGAWSRLHPDDRQGCVAYMQTMAESRPGDSFADGYYRLIHETGDTREIKVQFQIEYDAAGKACSLFGTLQDVTELNNQAEELKQVHSILNALVQSSTDTIFVKDNEGRYIVANPSLAALLGRPAEEILGTDDFSLFPHQSAERLVADDLRIKQSGFVQTYEENVEARRGTYDFLTTKGPLVIDGEVRGVFGIAHDISHRKQIEIALQESESLLRLFIEHAPAALAMFDHEMRYLAVSARWLTEYRLDRSDILGQSFYKIAPETSAYAKTIHSRGLAGEVVQCEEDRIDRKDGSVQWQRWEVRPWQEPDGSVGGIVIFSEDITQSIVAEQALRESEIRFSATFEQAAVGIAIVSLAGNWLRVNQKLCDIVGYEPAELLAMTFQDITHPDDLDLDLDNVRLMLAHEISHYSMEKRYLKKDGTPVWTNLKVSLVSKPDGDPDYFISVIEDITARKRGETALQESEARYRWLLENAPFPAVISRIRDDTLRYGNHRAEIQFALTREAGIGLPANCFYQDHAQRAGLIADLKEQGRVDDREVRMQTVDGKPFWALVSASIVDFENEPAVFAAINDITARKQTEAALREQETFFRLIAENMGDMVAVLDLEGRRLYNSPSYRDILGKPETLKGTDSFADIHPDDRDKVREVFLKTAHSGIGHRIDFRFMLPDGTVRHIESQGGAIRGLDGVIDRVVVVSRDVSERRKMENEIRAFNTELEQRVQQRTTELAVANQEMETFTYSVSHDLKAPLRGIEGYSRLLLEDYSERLDKTGCQMVNHVRHGVAQMNQLIDDLLSYSRIERQHLQAQKLDLTQLIDRVLDTLQSDIKRCGMKVEVSMQGMTAYADPDGLASVLRNLIDNAIKFTRNSDPPRLSITGIQNRKSITLKVTDNGMGFDMQFHDRIFEIFHRLHRAEEYPGTGVGLAIVNKAMQRMGGRVWAESTPGKGTSFFLELRQ